MVDIGIKKEHFDSGKLPERPTFIVRGDKGAGVLSLLSPYITFMQIQIEP